MTGNTARHAASTAGGDVADAAHLKERSAAQEHFIDLCRLLGEPTPAEAARIPKQQCAEAELERAGCKALLKNAP